MKRDIVADLLQQTPGDLAVDIDWASGGGNATRSVLLDPGHYERGRLVLLSRLASP